MKKIAEVSFTKQDLIDVLQEKDIPDFEINIDRLMKNLMGDGCNLEDVMIEAAWNYILDTVRTMNRRGKFYEDDIEPRCPRCGCPLIDSEVEGYTYTCPNCDEDLYSFEAR